MASSRLDPRHARIAREAAQHGHREYLSGRIHFMGGLAKDGQEARQFFSTSVGLQCGQGFLLTPYLVTIGDLGISCPKHHLTIDASCYGDVLGDARNVYRFGSSDHSLFLPFLFPSGPTTIGHRYTEFGWPAMGDPVGFRHVFDIPGSLGKEIRICGEAGNWIYSQHSLVTILSAKATLNSGWRCPLMSATGTAPSAGQRVSVREGLSCFDDLDLPDDGFARGTVCRSSPSAIWRAALRATCEKWNEDRLPVDIDSANQPATARTGVRGIQDNQRSRAAYRRRSYERSLRQFNRLTRPHVVRPCRGRSVDLFPNWRIGRVGMGQIDKYPGSSSYPVRSDVEDEDFTGDFTWVTSGTNRLRPSDLSPFVFGNGWSRRPFQFTYKRAWYAAQFFCPWVVQLFVRAALLRTHPTYH